MYRTMGRLAPATPLRFTFSRSTQRPGHLKEYMLCPQCENQFSRYERAGGLFLTKLNGLSRQTEAHRLCLSSLDYHRLKLFFLSLLWRCAVCDDPLTGTIDLGSRLASLTALLRADTPGSANEFPVILRLLAESQEAKNAVLTAPVPMRRARRRGYAMVGNGVEISWLSDKRGASSESLSYILHQDGSWLIKVVRGFDSPLWSLAVRSAYEHDRRVGSFEPNQ